MDLRDKIDSPELEKFLEKYELKNIHTDILERVATLIIAALGLVAALAWDEALHHFFDELFGGSASLGEQVAYALLITCIAALITVSLGKLIIKQRRKE